MPDLAEVSQVPGNYPEYIEATIANGLEGKISWEDLQLSIDDGSINFAAHTFDAYINFYFPEVLAKYGLYFSNVSGEPIVPGYVSLYSNNPPVTMPDTVVDFPTLKAWIIANIGTLVGDSYVDDCIFDSDLANYRTENGMPDLNISLKNGDILCEARLKCFDGLGDPIVGATNPPKKPGVESTFVGEFRGDAYGGKIICDSVDAKTINAITIGDAANKVSTVYANNIGTGTDRADYIYSWNIGDTDNKVTSIYAGAIGSPSAKVKTVYAERIGYTNGIVDTVYTNNLGTSSHKVTSIYAVNIGSQNVPVNMFYSNYVGGSSAPVRIIYAKDIGSASKPVTNLYATNVILKNIPTSDPGVAGALWNDGGVLKISAGQQQA